MNSQTRKPLDEQTIPNEVTINGSVATSVVEYLQEFRGEELNRNKTSQISEEYTAMHTFLGSSSSPCESLLSQTVAREMLHRISELTDQSNVRNVTVQHDVETGWVITIR